MAQTAWPASEKQLAFYTKLMGEREVEDPTFGLVENATSKEASAAIDALLKMPKIAQAPLPELPPVGYYVFGTEVFVVVKSKHTERRYAKKAIKSYSGKKYTWAYAPGAIAKLAGALPVTVDEAAQFGHLHGYCVICGAELTDPKSVQQGIGPVCIKKVM